MKNKEIKRYKKYKDSGIPWLGEIPEHWEISKLKYYLIANDGGVWGHDGGKTYVLRSTEINIEGKWNFLNEPAKRKLTEDEIKKHFYLRVICLLLSQVVVNCILEKQH